MSIGMIIILNEEHTVSHIAPMSMKQYQCRFEL